MTKYIKKAMQLHRQDNRIVQVTFYLDGWVPNSYKYRAPGNTVVVRIKEGKPTAHESGYDRKRRYGQGPSIVAVSEKGGRLYSA